MLVRLGSIVFEGLKPLPEPELFSIYFAKSHVSVFFGDNFGYDILSSIDF
jgi:hypothetical protein